MWQSREWSEEFLSIEKATQLAGQGNESQSRERSEEFLSRLGQGPGR